MNETETENKSIRPLRKEVVTTLPLDRGTGGILLSLCTLAGIAVGFSVANIAHAVRLGTQPQATHVSEYESIAPAWLGVRLRNAAGEHGARVVSVSPMSPADRAGIQPGDIIYAVDNIEVDNVYSLIGAIRNHEPFELAKLDVLRRDHVVSTTARLEHMPTWVFRSVRHDLSLRCIATISGERCRLR